MGAESLYIEKKIRGITEKATKEMSEESKILTEVILRCDKTTDVFVRLQTSEINEDLISLFARKIS